jgi:hypothetical protein
MRARMFFSGTSFSFWPFMSVSGSYVKIAPWTRFWARLIQPSSRYSMIAFVFVFGHVMKQLSETETVSVPIYGKQERLGISNMRTNLVITLQHEQLDV